MNVELLHLIDTLAEETFLKIREEYTWFTVFNLNFYLIDYANYVFLIFDSLTHPLSYGLT